LIDQSNKKKDEGRESMITQPFTVDITAIQTKGRAQKKQKHAGASGKKRLRPQFQNINVNALIEINNNDNYCLFRAAEMARAKKSLNDQDFRNYKKSEPKQLADLMLMLQHIEIDENMTSYAIEDYGPQMQQYYDQYWPATYKIFAFKSMGCIKPFWKSNTDNWTTPVVVYYQEEEQHYDAVDNTGHLFGAPDDKGHLRGQYCWMVSFSILQISNNHENLVRSPLPEGQ
jgi:hypothetical protein